MECLVCGAAIASVFPHLTTAHGVQPPKQVAERKVSTAPKKTSNLVSFLPISASDLCGKMGITKTNARYKLDALYAKHQADRVMETARSGQKQWVYYPVEA